jgi:hypothetical protein
MNTSLITIPANTLPPSVIGIDPAAPSITWTGIAKVGAATAVAAVATTIQSIRVSRRDMEARIAELERANIVLRAKLELAEIAAAKATTAKPATTTKAPKATRQRWTDAERDALAALAAAAPTGRPGWARIAAAMSDRFGRSFSAASVSSQARRARPA